MIRDLAMYADSGLITKFTGLIENSLIHLLFYSHNGIATKFYL